MSAKRPSVDQARPLRLRRMTGQRALILKIIKSARGHLDADELYRLARREQPRLSLSTVYRTLRALKEAGLVDEVHFDEEHHHYEPKPGAEHHHLVCLGCGRVIEFELPLARLVKRNVAAARHFEITAVETRISGYCAECQRGRQRST